MIELATGRLWALTHPYPLDGRVSTHPPDTRGFATMNSYLLVDGEHALLVDTGLSIHQEALLAQLRARLRPGAELSLFPLRIGEYSSICNVRPIADQLGVRMLYGTQGSPADWVDFRPEFTAPGAPGGGGGLASATAVTIRAGDAIALGTRRVLALEAPLRLLPTVWAYDEETATLLTSDSFTQRVLERPGEDPVVRAPGDDPDADAEALWEHLVRTRYWWLPGARADPIRAAIDDIFERHPVRTIAPAYGSIVTGEDAVAYERALLDRVLAEAPGRAGAAVAR